MHLCDVERNAQSFASHTPPRGAPQAASFIKPSDTEQGTDRVRLLSTDHSGAEHVRPEMALPRPLRDRHSRQSDKSGRGALQEAGGAMTEAVWTKRCQVDSCANGLIPST